MIDAKPLVLVVSGGAVGACARYGLAELFPGIWTIAVVNVVGSLLLGTIAALLGPDRLWRLFLGTGVLGGFTTFSAFAVDAVGADALLATAYIAATLAPALLAARAGMAFGHLMRVRGGAL